MWRGFRPGSLSGLGEPRLTHQWQLGWRRMTAGVEGRAILADLLRQYGRRHMWVHDPRVAQTSGTTHRDRLIGGHPDRRVRLLERTDGGSDAWHRVEPAVKLHVVLRPQPFDHLERFQEAGDALRHRDAERCALLGSIAKAHPEDHPSVGDRVERRHLLGDVHGIVQRQQEDGDADPHVAGVGRQPRHQWHRARLLEWRGQMMLADDEQVEPQLAHQVHLFDHLVDAPSHRLANHVLVREIEAELHTLTR